ncbi:MAG: ferritin family protein [Candidatus Omnitrophota bacterium]|nr:ferritin family protein [Candidatus Omnitrophota bacterium]
MNIFNMSEIVDLGIEKEKKRRDFYGLVAERFSDKNMKELFTKLRDWEDAHIKKFTEIRGSIKNIRETENYEGELNSYMQALLDDKLYKDVSPAKFSANVKTPLDAISYGIGFEKDAIIFFNEIVNYAVDARKDVIKKLIEEEKQHIVYLAALRENVV